MPPASWLHHVRSSTILAQVRGLPQARRFANSWKTAALKWDRFLTWGKVQKEVFFYKPH